MWILKDKRFIAGILALVISVGILALAVFCFDLNVLEHNPYDSYTRQALAWREGRLYLDNDPAEIAYLELAIFEGKYYVSFPPVPSLVELVLTFFFGADTPNQLMLYIYTVISCVSLTLLFAKKHSLHFSLCMGIMASVGTNLLGIVAFGGVWHEAQAMSFMLCSLAVLLIECDRKVFNGLSLFCAALAVGCRPFTVLFIPFLLFRLYQKNTDKPIYKLIPYLIAPAIVAFLLMLYNYVRFNNPFEFGHNYLPEFLRAEEGQFSTKYLWDNLIQAIKLPFDFKPEFKLNINKFTANIFYIFNPVIAVFLVKNVAKIIRERNLFDILWLMIFAMFVVFTCMHKTLGGCQFGARYFIDVIPYLALYLSYQKYKYENLYWHYAVFATELNFYGMYFVQKNF